MSVDLCYFMLCFVWFCWVFWVVFWWCVFDYVRIIYGSGFCFVVFGCFV